MRPLAIYAKHAKKREEIMGMSDKDRAECLAYTLGKIYGALSVMDGLPQRQWQDHLNVLLEAVATDITRLFYAPTTPERS